MRFIDTLRVARKNAKLRAVNGDVEVLLTDATNRLGWNVTVAIDRAAQTMTLAHATQLHAALSQVLEGLRNDL